MDRLKQETEKIKDQIIKFNNNLNTEFDNYGKYRNENLKKIMSCYCYVQREKAKKMVDFSNDQQKNFPLYDFSTLQIESPLPSPKKAEVKVDDASKGLDDFENIDRKLSEP